jgi:hypothetical protein
MGAGLCQYKDIFGKPNTGIHTTRLFNIAIADSLATALLGVFIKYTFKIKMDLLYIILLLVIASIPLHMLFCVDTTLVKMLQ